MTLAPGQAPLISPTVTGPSSPIAEPSRITTGASTSSSAALNWAQSAARRTSQPRLRSLPAWTVRVAASGLYRTTRRARQLAASSSARVALMQAIQPFPQGSLEQQRGILFQSLVDRDDHARQGAGTNCCGLPATVTAASGRPW